MINKLVAKDHVEACEEPPPRSSPAPQSQNRAQVAPLQRGPYLIFSSSVVTMLNIILIPVGNRTREPEAWVHSKPRNCTNSSQRAPGSSGTFYAKLLRRLVIIF